MPTKLPSPCRAPGCAAIVQGGGYCQAHRHLSARVAYDQGKRRNDPSLAFAARIRSSIQWRKVRALHRAQSPTCCDPFGHHAGFPALAAESHHIKPLATHPELAFDLGNLAPLCSVCHHAVEALERAGRPTAQLFAELGKIPQQQSAVPFGHR